MVNLYCLYPEFKLKLINLFIPIYLSSINCIKIRFKEEYILIYLTTIIT